MIQLRDQTKNSTKTEKRKVLIVDDALDTRTLLSMTFKQEGFRVYLAKNGIEAYLKFFRIKPDILLVDVLLPRMRGDVLVKWIRGTALGRLTPIVIVSTHTAMREYLFQLGIELFFEKPIQTKDVLIAAREILEIYEGKKVLQERLAELRRKFGQQQAEDIPAVIKHKYCTMCQSTMPSTAIRCPNCGSIQLKAME